MGKQWKQWQTLFWGAPESLHMVTAAMKLKDTYSLEEKLWATRQHIEKQRYLFANKGLSSQSCSFSSGHVWMWELDSEESWALKNWCFWTVVLEKTLESPLDCSELQPVHAKGNQSWIFIGRTEAEAETPVTLSTWCEELTQLKRPWFWERLKMGGEGDDRGWDGWMASPTQWTWVCVNSGSWWWTGRPRMLQSMGLRNVGLEWVTELNWTNSSKLCSMKFPQTLNWQILRHWSSEL